MMKIVVLLFAILGLQSLDAAAVGSGEEPPITVTTIITEPFTSWKDRFALGNDRFQGYIPDLLAAISERTGIQYNLKLVSDARYGSRGRRGQWTGMIGDLQSGRAELAAAPMTMTSQREEVVDFTHPFAFTSLSIVFKKTLSLTSLEQVLEEVEAGRLTLGLIRGGSTNAFFKRQTEGTVSRLYAAMEGSSQSLVSSFDEGLQKVHGGNFAFIVEGVMAKYVISRSSGCELDVLPLDLSTRYYGMATRRGASSLRRRINEALLSLHEDGLLNTLYRKWWKNQCPAGSGSGAGAAEKPHLQITSILYDPHMKMAAGEHEGNARFEGLLPEYLTALSKQAGFDYTLHVVKDGKWGRQSSDGTWYGMVGELINNEADMAAAAMTVTSGRQEVVDFTSPLIIDGRSVLVKKTADVSTLTELVEKAEGGQISLLAVRGYTIELIRGSQNPLLQRLSDLVGDDNLVESPEKGIEMVKNGDYGFIAEDLVLAMAVAKDCELKAVGSFANSMYAFALKKNSPHRESINRAILTLNENGLLRKLKGKYYKNTC